ncbi:hypothetical protein HAX54_004641 [Datura stramonium]|uniref:Glucan endo-1,3-beta-D-glucosidase n=1 Tax=Datura stramonium TaxID=4076 RepID=A0ABS8T9N5_DATST|nr:hypothetical protein [Datura stramonium]
MGLFPFSKSFGVLFLVALLLFSPVSGIGVNWGTQSTHRLPPEIVVRMLKDNGIQKVKLFDADYDTLKALGKSGLEVMVGIPNDMLSTMGSLKAAEKWVSKNVSVHISNNNVNISPQKHLQTEWLIQPQLVVKLMKLSLLSINTELGPFPFGLPVLAPVGHGVKAVLEWIRIPHWLGNGLVVCLYGLVQSSPHELAFGVELVQVPYLCMISESGPSPFWLPVSALFGPRSEEVLE